MKYYYDKIITAVLEINVDVIRLLLGVFYNNRLNILKIKTISHNYIKDNFFLKEKNKIIKLIKILVKEVEDELEISIEKILLLIPNKFSFCKEKKITVNVKNEVITNLEFKKIYKKLININYNKKFILVNIIFKKFFFNNGSSFFPPFKKKSNFLSILVDLYFEKKKFVFPYVNCVEKAGYKVLDVVLNDIAVAKECSLFEKSNNFPISTFLLEKKFTKISLFKNGSLVYYKIFNFGLNKFITKIQNKFKISFNQASKIFFYNFNLNSLDKNNFNNDDPIFILFDKKKTSKIIKNKDISILLKKIFEKYILNLCKKICLISKSNILEILLIGKGSKIDGILNFIEKKKNIKTVSYIPSTFGARNINFISCLGAFYYYKDLFIYKKNISNPVKDEFLKKSLFKKKSVEETIITKLKKIFFSSL